MGAGGPDSPVPSGRGCVHRPGPPFRNPRQPIERSRDMFYAIFGRRIEIVEETGRF